MAKPGNVYIATNRRNGTLYIGVTSDLLRRAHEHRSGTVAGFTRKYDCKRIVHIEFYDDIRDAITRERTLKNWRRAWKIELIEQDNPAWRDLWPLILKSFQ